MEGKWQEKAGLFNTIDNKFEIKHFSSIAYRINAACQRPITIKPTKVKTQHLSFATVSQEPFQIINQFVCISFSSFLATEIR
jgi:hypothetical protein